MKTDVFCGVKQKKRNSSRQMSDTLMGLYRGNYFCSLTGMTLTICVLFPVLFGATWEACWSSTETQFDGNGLLYSKSRGN